MGCAASLAGFSGLLLAGRTNSGLPERRAGPGARRDLGGDHRRRELLRRARLPVLGVFAGALVIGLMRNILNLRDVQVFWQQVLIGVVIIAVVYLDVLRRRAGSSNA